MSYPDKPPASFTDIIDMLDKATRLNIDGNSFKDYVDDPKETPVTDSEVTRDIPLYTCLSCQVNVNGTTTYRIAEGAKPTLDEHGEMSIKMTLVGMRVPSHTCYAPVTP